MNKNQVTPKKHLGQHFLIDLTIAEDIAKALTLHGEYKKVLEIGPGTGALTQFLLKNGDFVTEVAEIDRESIEYLKHHYPDLKIHDEDFLRMDFKKFGSEPIAVAGNFPYNISSQILFKVLDERDQVPELVGMFQKEVAERVAEGPGSKTYSILSVLLQAYYDIEYLFTVPEHVFNPPPKVKSGVIRMKRNNVTSLPCDEKLFKTIVKATFNQRRKTVRNGIKPLLKGQVLEMDLLQKRPEQLSVEEFIALTNAVQSVTSA